MIAAQLDSVMEDLIGDQQCGFMRGRSSSSNILKTQEIIAYLNKRNKPGVVITVDFEKCFDRVEHAAIAGVLKYFNFWCRVRALGTFAIQRLHHLYSKQWVYISIFR